MSTDLRALSVEWERETFYDSIQTIELKYERTKSGAFRCCWRGCGFARRDAVALWKHIHTGHGNNDLPPNIS